MRVYPTELEALATQNPTQFVILFAELVAGEEVRPMGVPPLVTLCYSTGVARGEPCPDYLNDLGAVHRAGKHAGIKWDRAVVDEDEEGNEDVQYSAWKWKNDWLRNRHPVRCWQEPGWPECMALMLVMIEVAQLAREDGNNIQNAG